MSSKLQNIKAVKQMLEGSHKTQTRKNFSLATANSTAEKNKKREIGEEWIETINGVDYKIKQHDGFRMKRPANSILDEVNDALTLPKTCPKCGKDMHGNEKRLNQKMYFKVGHCFDCHVKSETKLRANPKKWENYSRKKMLANAKGWLKDADKEVETLKKTLKDVMWENADGKIGEIDRTAWLEKVDKDYKNFKKTLLDNLKGKNAKKKTTS